uniref:EF-hand domain-containing protein n=1 Tax=Panagrolaimus sp. JU765 TaxID=591449 RepID=A0AC34RH57_9BILA
MKLLIILAAVIFFAIQVDAHCCLTYEARDCCTVGPCNWFCCGCTEPCHSENCVVVAPTKPASRLGKSLAVDYLNAKNIFDLVDANKNGVVEFKEAANYLNISFSIDERAIHPKWFAEMDTNKDGVINPPEFDPLL